MESRLQDHERIRGGLYFIQAIPRDENWKVRRDILQSYEPKKAEDCTLNVSASLAQQVAESPKLNKKMVQELERQPNGAFVAAPEVTIQASSPRTKRVAKPLTEDPTTNSDPGLTIYFFDCNQLEHSTGCWWGFSP